MSKNKEDLSLFVAMMSNGSLIFSVIAGFIFTAITLLVTLLPDPSQLAAQATLFTLVVLFELCLNVVNDIDQIMIHCVRVWPPLPKDYFRRMNLLSMIVLSLIGLPIILMFLLWDLSHLALATIILDALFTIFAYFHIKPLREVRRRFMAETKKSWRIHKFFDERDIMNGSED